MSAHIQVANNLRDQCLNIINSSSEPLSPAQVYEKIDFSKLLGVEDDRAYVRKTVFLRLLYLSRHGKINKVGFGLYSKRA